VSKYKATAKFQELGIENSYSGLDKSVYWKLKEGKAVELSAPPEKLIKGKYLQIVKSSPKGADNG